MEKSIKIEINEKHILIERPDVFPDEIWIMYTRLIKSALVTVNQDMLKMEKWEINL